MQIKACYYRIYQFFDEIVKTEAHTELHVLPKDLLAFYKVLRIVLLRTQILDKLETHALYKEIVSKMLTAEQLSTRLQNVFAK